MQIQPCGPLRGEITVPGDKSISHRAVMLGALANGTTHITGFLMGEDCLSTIDCFRKMGVEINITDDEVIVEGVGLHGLEAPSEALYTGNSGTTTRLLCGILAAEIVRSAGSGSAIRSGSDYFISDLIRGNLRNPELVEARLAYLNWNLRQYKYLLLVQWEQEDRNIDFRDACMAALNSIFPDGRCVLDGVNMVVLFSTDAKLTVSSPPVDLIRAYLSKTGLVAVLSMPFTDLWEAAYYYDQACDILSLNQRLGREDQFLLAEASAFELLLQEASKKYHLIDYCHPLVRSLMEYDQREGKDYLTTLRAFAIAGMNYTKAAELLHMHRNSVIYRMKQIEEILDFDFSSMEFGFHIDLSFRILDYMESIESHRWSRKENCGGERF